MSVILILNLPLPRAAPPGQQLRKLLPPAADGAPFVHPNPAESLSRRFGFVVSAVEPPSSFGQAAGGKITSFWLTQYVQ